MYGELARQAVRGALHAGDGQSAGENLAGPAVAGVVQAFNKDEINPYGTLSGAAYGVVEGAIESGLDLEQATREILSGARQIARDLNLKEEWSVQQAAAGALQAARKIGGGADARVRAVLSRELGG